MFRKRLGAVAKKVSESGGGLAAGPQQAAEAYVTGNLPAIRDACDRVLARMATEGRTTGGNALRLSAAVVADEKRFKDVLSGAFDCLPVPRIVPRWLFVRVCLGLRKRFLALVAPLDGEPR